MRTITLMKALSLTPGTLLLALLLAAPVQAHVRILDPMSRTEEAGLREYPCGGRPAGESVATYQAGSEIEVMVRVPVVHTDTMDVRISNDDFATQSILATVDTPARGTYAVTVTLPSQPLGAWVMQAAHENYVSCADITLTGTQVFAINAGLNDAWFNPATAGQGFFIIVYPDIPLMFLAWFTYDTERPSEDVTAVLGEPGHRWITAQGGFAGDTATLDVFLTAGGVFDAMEPQPSPAEKIGTITIVWADCKNAILTYDIPDLGLMGEVPLQRIALDNVALCEALNDE